MWEYRLIPLPFVGNELDKARYVETELNELGSQRWELVTVVAFSNNRVYAILKRKINATYG